MINIMIKRTVILVVAILAGASISAQGKYGADEQKCKENLSMFREYYKQKNYTDAYIPWMWSFNNCPESSQNIYKNGPRIIKAKMKADKENKLAYIDTLMMVFDQRIEYFGKEGYVLGLKGFELIGIDKTRSEEALGYLKKSLDLEGNNASVQAVYGYMKAMVNLEKSGNKTKADVLAAYAVVSEIIDFNIVNESKATKNFVKYSEKVENLFTPYANCDDLIALFSQKFDSATDDVNLLKRITKLLSDKKCTDSDLFFNASSRLYELEPSASSADQISKMSIAKGKTSDAILFAKKAIETEEDANTKAKYYLALADAYRSSGSYSSARGAVYSALELRSGWGEAYINLGNIYVAGAKSCGSDFETQTVYWVAVDSFKQALSDAETKDRASKGINTYSKYFPTKENCFFNGITADSKHTVGCWINQTTIARTSD
jgi:tetratricopeptide (TPR) repeat protein